MEGVEAVEVEKLYAFVHAKIRNYGNLYLTRQNEDLLSYKYVLFPP